MFPPPASRRLLFLPQSPAAVIELLRIWRQTSHWYRHCFSTAATEASPSTSLTSQQRKLKCCIHSLPADFTPSDLSSALLSLPDPDLAHDLFRWAALRPAFRHSPLSYHTILRISISHRRLDRAEALLDEIVSGACPCPDLPLIHTALRFCCSRPRLLSRALDLLNLLPRLSLRPSVHTFHPLLTVLVRRLDRHPAYMNAIRSLARRMDAAGVAPDTLASNLLIRAHSRCLEMHDALRIFRQMRLRPDCEPNEFTYGYLARGLCEKGRIGEGLALYREMRVKGLLPTARVYMILVNCLSMDRSYAEAMEVLRDMLGNGFNPDLLTCRTLLEGLCREGKKEEATGLLGELRMNRAVSERTYSELVDAMRWLSPEFRS